jgi:hypothetical protein
MYLISFGKESRPLVAMSYGMREPTHFAEKTTNLANPYLKAVLMPCAKITDFALKIFASLLYNFSAFVFNNTYARIKNLSIEKWNQEQSKKWNFTALKTWAAVGSLLLLGVGLYSFRFFRKPPPPPPPKGIPFSEKVIEILGIIGVLFFVLPKTPNTSKREIIQLLIKYNNREKDSLENNPFLKFLGSSVSNVVRYGAESTIKCLEKLEKWYH